MSQKQIVAARRAMGTRFELVLNGESESYLQGVAEAIFEEISRLDAKLSYYNDSSDINDINAHAAKRMVLADPPLFHLLTQAKAWSEKTGGAFDITIAPLLRCWGFVGGMGAKPDPEAIEEARKRVGMSHVRLYPECCGVEFDVEGVEIELGSIGKGYALDCAAEMLRDYEITSALLHGGTSSVCAIGAPPDAETWNIAIQKPFAQTEGEHIAHVSLKNNSLSVSAPTYKSFEHNGERYGHVIDARTGYPAPRHALAAIVCNSALEGDVCSTALLARGSEWLESFATLVSDGEALFARHGDGGDLLIERSALQNGRKELFQLIREPKSRD